MVFVYRGDYQTNLRCMFGAVFLDFCPIQRVDFSPLFFQGVFWRLKVVNSILKSERHH
jgi:hypothetical protein